MPTDDRSIEQELAVLLHGVADEIPKGGLLPKLALARKEGRPLRVKWGADPSAPHLHLGHTVVLRKIRQFQDFGHTVDFLIGDFTGMIGDPTGRSTTRPALTRDEIMANAKTYTDQVFRILDEKRTIIRFNSEWCGPLTFSDVIKWSAKLTVARILEREDFMTRYKAGQPIHLHEFLYPLVQGYDSVVLKTDIEMCGHDQIFNCHVGRLLQESDGQHPEVILAMPLLEGTDGVKKMSKSQGNAIGITEAPNEMYGQLLSIPDAMIEKYASLLLDSPLSSALSPRDAKHALARAIVGRYHGDSAAAAAADHFEKVIIKGELALDAPEVDKRNETVINPRVNVVELMIQAGLAESKNKARELIRGGGVRLDGSKILHGDVAFPVRDGAGLQVGKHGKGVRVRTSYDPQTFKFSGQFTEAEFRGILQAVRGNPARLLSTITVRIRSDHFVDVTTWGRGIRGRTSLPEMIMDVIDSGSSIQVVGEHGIPQNEAWVTCDKPQIHRVVDSDVQA